MSNIYQTMEFIIKNESELISVAEYLIEAFPEQRIFYLIGDLGAGKTRLVQTIAKLLGVKQSVNSPTYSIVNDYESDHGLVYHMDLYRLKREEELYEIGMEEYLYSNNYCFIEWPNILDSVFDIDPIEIKIEISSKSERKIII